VIIGGGLAGLISSIQLIRAGVSCTLVEKKSYPFHRVCGEYISNEALPFLKAANLYPEAFAPSQIKRLEISSGNGLSWQGRLDLGGFGISRFAFDNHLCNIARSEGVKVLTNTEVTEAHFIDNTFTVKGSFGELPADVVIGAFGKRSKLDVQQQRDFIRKRSPYVGVKYHVHCDQPADLISLHNFSGGYCGVCAVEEGVTNLCYLTHRDNLKTFGSTGEMEKTVLFRNPRLKDLFTNSSFLFARPEVINEVSFETKGPVENHILMAGDAAGMITPVCGNGMAIAIRSGKIISELVTEFCADRIDRVELETRYRARWNDAFRRRLWFGRQVQHLFGSERFSTFSVTLARSSGMIANMILRNTHGDPF